MMQDPEVWARDKVELDKWHSASTMDLIHHIVGHYHREARVEMARLESQADEAVLLEGSKFPVLLDIRNEVDRLCVELRNHLAVEERMLFPAMLDIAEGRTPAVPVETLEPMRLLEDEHDAAAGLLNRLRVLTEGFNPPEGARAVQRKFFETLQTLANSLYRHIYLENQILFQRLK